MKTLFLLPMVLFSVLINAQNINFSEFLSKINSYEKFEGGFDTIKAMNFLFGDYKFSKEYDCYVPKNETNEQIYYLIQSYSFNYENTKMYYLFYGSNTIEMVKQSCHACSDNLGVAIFINYNNMNYRYFINDKITFLGGYNNASIDIIDIGINNKAFTCKYYSAQNEIWTDEIIYGFYDNKFSPIFSYRPNEEGSSILDMTQGDTSTISVVRELNVIKNNKNKWFDFSVKTHGRERGNNKIKIKNQDGETVEINEVVPINTIQYYTFSNDKYIKSNNTGMINANDNNNLKSISDVDINIPEDTIKKNNYFALIIGNEDYASSQPGLKKEANVQYAERDAIIFKEYLIKTLGILENNITTIINAKSIEFSRAIEKISLFPKPLDGNAELIIFYAGHGLSDEITKDAYLIPVDIAGTELNKYAIKLQSLYETLTKYEPKKVTVFLDACFSGGARNQGLLSTRGVKIKPKDNLIKGNIIIFASSSEDQSSFAYDEQQHGLFTYYLLKKIKETKGELNYAELSKYLKKEVGIKSIQIKNSEQIPQTIINSELQNIWSKWTLK